MINVQEHTIYRNRFISSEKPNIGFDLDTKMKIGNEKSNSFFYPEDKLATIIKSIEKVGGNPFVILLSDFYQIPDILENLDGFIITGGRDLHPQFYNQKNKSCILNKQSRKRYYFVKLIMEEIDQRMPVLGICYGAQFLNVFYGGSLIQDINDVIKKHTKQCSFNLEGKWMKSACGDSMKGYCNHHQVIDQIGKDLEIIARDDLGMIHGFLLQKDNQFKLGIQWHLERCHDLDKKIFTENDEENSNLVQQFLNECKKFKNINSN